MTLSSPDLARRLLEAAPVLALLLDAQGAVAYINPYGERLVGYSAEELSQLDWFATVLPPEQREALRARLAQVLAGSPPQQRTFPILTRSGEWRHIEWSSQVVADDGGTRRWMLTIGRDVTERVAAEAQLLASEQRYRELFEGNPHPMWVYAVDSLVFLAVNDAAVARYGYPREQFLRMTLRDIRPAEDLPRLADSVRATREGFEHSESWRHRLSDGRLIDVEISSQAMTFEGRPARLVLATDVTERRRTEALLLRHQEELEAQVRLRTAELEAARDEAERANRAKSEFLSRMSHELRTPMNAILGFGQLLALDAKLADAQQGKVKEILHAGDHLLGLINEVLDLARVESGQLALSLEAIDLSALIAECVRMSMPAAQQRGITLSCPPSPTSRVLADRMRLRQVLLNLLSNAIKYNRPDGGVTVETGVDGDTARILVSDTGPGIAPEQLSRLFQPFQRLGAEHGQVPGTGIGLSISRQLVELMGGHIGVDSAPGQGARFWVELPLAPPASGRPTV